MRLRLKEIGLAKIDKHGKRNGKPIIKERTYYLARIGANLYFGRFSRQWYGWNFDDGWGASGHQFDPPGTNRSDWKQLWEVVSYFPTG